MPKVKQPKQPFTLESKSVAALPVINHFLRRLRFETFLTQFLPPPDKRAKLTDTRVLGILLRNLTLAREPLYGMREWADGFVPELLGLAPQESEWLNDDRVGRALDRLFDADRSALLTEIVLLMVREFKLDMTEFHNDSTSLPLFGKFRSAVGSRVRGKATVAAAHGHSKDHRPDLKQLVWILTVSDDGAVPVHFKVTDGNTEDSGTHIQSWQTLRALVGKSDFLYVADSKLCTAENQHAIHAQGGRFITVLPRTRGEDHLMREWLQANLPDWMEVWHKPPANSRRGIPEFIVGAESPIPDSYGYRLVWYRSSSKMENDAGARQEMIQKASQRLADLAARLNAPRSRFGSASAVAKEADEILTKAGATRWIVYTITASQQERYRQEKRGRPTQEMRWRRTTKARFHLQFEIVHSAVDYDSKCDGIFPLVTNDRRASLREILAAYKSNQPHVEKRHHFLKTVLEAVPLTLKNIARIEALLFLLFVALLTRSLIERELRNTMIADGSPSLPLYPEARPCSAPTAERVFEILSGLQRHRLRSGKTLVQEFPPALNELQSDIVRLLGLSKEAFA